MKKLITLMIMVLAVASLMAQTPEKFSYQAVVRNTTNQLVTNAPVSVRVSILQGSADGQALYVETHSAVTNANGLLTVEIGGGKAERGAFDRIDWADGPYFLMTETDPNGGGEYSVTSTQQLLSVPYALYAKEAANSFSGDYNDLRNKPAIPQNVGELTNDAGYITLNDIPAAPKGGETNDAGVVQTTACGEIDLCEMANQLAQLAQRQEQMDEMRNALLPTVTTTAVSNITETTATGGGNVTSKGYSAVTARGMCYGTEPNPTVAGNHTSDGTGTGAFTSALAGLQPNTTYYVKAYATNSIGTAYGEEVNFTTAEHDNCATISLPYSEDFESYTTSTTLETGVQPECWKLIAEDVALTNATKPQLYRGYATSGSYSLRMKNRCIYAMPALSEEVNVSDLTMTFNLRQPNSAYRLQVGVVDEYGVFTLVKTIKCNGTGVEAKTVSFSNYTGTSHRIAFRNTLVQGYTLDYSVNYIDDITINGTVSATLPTVITGAVSEITATTAIGGGEVTADGGAEVTGRGVCWSTEPNPTVEGNNTSDGTGTGEFISTLADLQPNTTYYVRAYAINSEGTAYGEEVTFTTAEEQQDICAINALPFTEDFESYTTSTTTETGVQPDCWEVTTEDVTLSNATKPQLYRGFATSGSYSLRMKNRCVYAMPVLREDVSVRDLTMTFNLRQPNSAYRLQVGVVDESGAFTLVKTIKCNGTGIESKTVDFSNYTGTGHRIAFRNTLVQGSSLDYSINYIDDITIILLSNTVVDEKSCPGVPTVTDIDGNTYSTVKIGQQCWMRENLKTTHYADGVDIPYGVFMSDDYLSSTEPYYYYYNYNDSYYYNGPAAMRGTASNTANPNSVQGICPNGWHLPSDAEWGQLLDYVSSEYSCGGGYIAKALASTQGWDLWYCGMEELDDEEQRSCSVCDTITNNASGFGARPVGVMFPESEWYWTSDDPMWCCCFVGAEAGFWSTSNSFIYIDVLPTVTVYGSDSDMGLSVRCLSDASSGVGGSTATLPTVVTSSVSNITVATATCGGEVTSSGGVYVTGRGVCWSTEPNPTVDDSHTSVGQGSGAFTSSITGLISGTTYYVRAYATNREGTAYGEEVSFTTTVVVGIPAGDAQPCPGAATVTDYDGNVYNTVKIGEQCWMKENLRTTHFPDGMPISTSGGSDSSPCLYNYSSSGVDLVLRGYLYNWTAVMYGAASSSTNPSNVQGICPDGWHVPSDAEWTQLTDYVNSLSAYRCGDVSGNIAKALAVTEGWNSSTADGAIGYNPSGNNATGFSAVSAGYKDDLGFRGAGCDACFWSSKRYYRRLNYDSATVSRNDNDENYGYSVRCLRD